MAFDFYAVISVILVFTLATTLRYSIEGTLVTGNPMLRFVTHPWWLYALVLAGPFVLGAFYNEQISPWPPTAYAEISARSGHWAGVAAALGAAIADIWMLWGAATTFKRFAPPEERRFVPVYYIVNAAVGLYLLARFYHLINVPSMGLKGG